VLVTDSSLPEIHRQANRVVFRKHLREVATAVVPSRGGKASPRNDDGLSEAKGGELVVVLSTDRSLLEIGRRIDRPVG